MRCAPLNFFLREYIYSIHNIQFNKSLHNNKFRHTFIHSLFIFLIISIFSFGLRLLYLHFKLVSYVDSSCNPIQFAESSQDEMLHSENFRLGQFGLEQFGLSNIKTVLHSRESNYDKIIPKNEVDRIDCIYYMV